MLALFGGMITTKIISDLIEMYDKNGTKEFINYLTTIFGNIFNIVYIFNFILSL